MKIKLLKNTFIIILILCIVLLFSHFILIDQQKFWRLVYPLQANIASMTSRCSSQAPLWMKEAIHYAIHQQKNLSNQLAYIDAQQKLHHCESGWRGAAVFSEKLQPEQRFRYASLTKILTSHAVLDLIQQKQLSLDTRFIDLFEELKQADYQDSRIKIITIGYLLEHRSGFDRMKSEDVVFATDKKSWCPNDLSALTKQRLDFEPNAKYAYDNRNYCLLGAVIERLSGQSYRNYMIQHYLLNQYNMKFIDGVYFSDEVKYDFRNNDFWMESDDNRFDFNALSSSAGLSGSAKQLALLMNKMLSSEPYNILSIQPDTLKHCNIEEFKSCNGYAMWQYRASSDHPVMYFRNGGLPAVTSLAMVTAKNEVVVWLGNGASLYNEEYDENLLEKYFYIVLNN